MSDKDSQKARKSRRSPREIAKHRFECLEVYSLSVSTTQLHNAIKGGNTAITECATEIEHLNGAFDVIRQYLFPESESGDSEV